MCRLTCLKQSLVIGRLIVVIKSFEGGQVVGENHLHLVCHSPMANYAVSSIVVEKHKPDLCSQIQKMLSMTLVLCHSW